MLCPFCNKEDSRVIDSRAVDDGRAIRRRRGCPHCGKRFTTFETVEQLPLMVVKHDGSRQVFDRNKLLNGLIRSCDKRDKSLESVMILAHDIEQDIHREFEQEVPSKAIGEMTLKHLKNFDQVAYIRFASVYRKFSDINSFRHELDVLLADDDKND
ncbi:MAG: transcriptional repressor NrdR [Anaerovibrio sp.]|jgi:transcriptional repressor NrdR|nr:MULTISPECIES: transcriptional regulator NrdR [Anaerovibrio]MBE6105208.1 transcriptional repressor NrdR [Anaerovibrio lipolyticus]MBO5589237.1 transcriptional repressor NrdR [Anaerovibrio sp.]MBO6244785.1 transcriptional repressor NrdR [Anaerovibrio sp.]